MPDTVLVTAPDANQGVLSPTLSDAIAAAQLYASQAQSADADAIAARAGAIDAQSAALNSAASAAASAALAAEYAAEANGGSTGATTLSADLLIDTNTLIPNPKNVPFFRGDGTQVPDGAIVFLPNQTNGRQNGLWRYIYGTNTLVRADNYQPASTIKQPILVEIGDGGTVYAGATWALVSPASATIDVDATSWQDASLSAGVQPPSSFVAGPTNPSSGPRPALVRGLTPQDSALYKPRQTSNTYYPQSIYLNLNRHGYVSRLSYATSPWDQRSAIIDTINRFTTTIFEETAFVNGTIPVPSGKRLVFCGTGLNGNCKVYQYNTSATVFDLSGATDVCFEGELDIQYVGRSATAVKAIRATSGALTRVRLDHVATKGVDYAINLSPASYSYVRIGTVLVDDAALDIPLLVGGATTTGLETVRVGSVETQPAVTIVGDANKVYTPFIDGETLIYSGAITATRNVTLGTSNRVGNARLTVYHAGSGSSINVLGLKTIAPGSSAKIAFAALGAPVLAG